MAVFCDRSLNWGKCFKENILAPVSIGAVSGLGASVAFDNISLALDAGVGVLGTMMGRTVTSLMTCEVYGPPLDAQVPTRIKRAAQATAQLVVIYFSDALGTWLVSSLDKEEILEYAGIKMSVYGGIVGSWMLGSWALRKYRWNRDRYLLMQSIGGSQSSLSDYVKVSNEELRGIDVDGRKGQEEALA